MDECKISAQEFWSAFTKAVCEAFADSETWKAYPNDAQWTQAMFGEKCKNCEKHKKQEKEEFLDRQDCYSGILGGTLKNLKLAGWDGKVRRFCGELYTVDSVFAGTSSFHKTLANHGDHGWSACGFEGRRFPEKLQVLIEHENQGLIETEFYKLLFWRAPLKVIIAYDYKKKVSSEKRNVFREALKRCWEAWPENPHAEYLFIVGKGEYNQEKAPIKVTWSAWRYTAPGDEMCKLVAFTVPKSVPAPK